MLTRTSLITRRRIPASVPVQRRASVQSAFICRETVVLFVLCLLDTLSSAWLFSRQLAEEANPLLRGAAEAGWWPFVLVKVATFLPALLAAEWMRRRRPGFVPVLLRWVIVSYVVIYGVGVGSQFLPR